ncbi:MAG: glycoside hydrolase family 2 protein [Hyphomicrobiales bacterium]|nr:glycoside hydrolase family 2 protein [Hyphomicrobiales bacterium]
MRLSDGWRMAICGPGAASSPSQTSAFDWIEAQAPGTAAQALIAADRWSWDAPPPLDQREIWYSRAIDGQGRHRLTLEGLATFADVFLDDALLLSSANMFVAQSVDVVLSGAHRLSIRFKSLADCLAGRKGRARWRPRMIQPPDLRFARTSALGRMPGFAPPAPPVGPWRPVTLVSLDRLRLVSSRIATRLDGADGIVDAILYFTRAPDHAPILWSDGTTVRATPVGSNAFVARLRLPDVRKWFPHTHGEPHLYDVFVQIGEDKILLARSGFRSIDIDAGADGRGFALRVNGLPVFCRGAVWTPIDPVSLQNEATALQRVMALARAANVNMFRIGGTGVYESDDIYRACDEAGILVWHDFMFSNFDYPAHDPAFLDSVEAEVRQFLARTSASPSLAVLCGGNEVFQQAAMMGVAETAWRSPLFDELLPRIARQERGDAPYVANSPDGGALPFLADSGVTHYYGVGAYRRPIEDARRANVRFASECLGFANIPETRSLVRDFGDRPLASPLWKTRTPRDQGADQDFEDVRDHYVALLYGLDPAVLRRDDPARYLDLSRACVVEVIEATISEWRRPGSTCAGALLWFWKDFWPSSGFGALDWRGGPKSPWWAMRRAFRPTQIVLSDEGVNGLHVHCINETATLFRGVVTLRCYRDGATVVMDARREIEIAPRSHVTLRDCEFWGAFFDTTYAYRFGPPSHEATTATLSDVDGVVASRAWHFPLGRAAAMYGPQIQVEIVQDEIGPGLRLASASLAQSVKIEDDTLTPLDNWLHLAPGERRLVRFIEREGVPRGLVAALGAPSTRYGQ